MIRFGRRSDSIVALFVVAVTAMFLLYVPPFAVDMLIVVNLATAILLLLVTLYVPDPSKLYVFPTILLLSTLFRLGLNVATTRLILLNGYAGEVIQAFGQFLIRGEVVVGVVIFSIITIVNFIVVARGASRVAEVAARFTLDAMPVKQMAIESDMRAGILTAQEAVRKREELRKESQLYGSMDGAMKFVQGDVIAGIIIIFTNIFGGLYVGIRDGLSVADAAQTYTLLTVGDGLVSQIPALLIAICSGIVVTRVASGGETTLGMDIGGQLLKRPEAWSLSGIIMIIIALLPGPPFVPFAVGGTFFLIIAYFAPRLMSSFELASPSRGSSIGASYNLLPSRSGSERLPLIEWSSAVEGGKTIVLELDSETLYPLYLADNMAAKEKWQVLQGLFWQQVGLSVPALNFSPRPDLMRGGYKVVVDGISVIEGRLPLDCFMVELNPAAAPIFGLPVELEETHPLYGTSVFWTPGNFSSFTTVQSAELNYSDQLEFIFFKIISYFKNNPQDLITSSDIYTHIKELGTNYPGLVGGLIDSGLITVPRLTRVVQQLAREGFNVGNLRSILENLAEHYSGYDASGESPFILDDVVNALRQSRAREIYTDYVSDRGVLRVVSIGSEFKTTLESVMAGHDLSDVIKIEREMAQNIRRYFVESIGGLRVRGIMPAAIICEPYLKPALLAAITAIGENFRVVLDKEIGSSTIVEFVAELGA